MLGRFTRLAVFPLLGVVALVSGCDAEKGDLTGKVTYNGRPVTSGTVQVFLPDGATKTAEIGADGSYKLLDVLEGPVKLGVSSPHPLKRYNELLGYAKTEEQRKAIHPPAPELVKSWAALPDALARPETSGLVATVKKGETTHDLVLSGSVLAGKPDGPKLPDRPSDKDKK